MSYKSLCLLIELFLYTIIELKYDYIEKKISFLCQIFILKYTGARLTIEQIDKLNRSIDKKLTKIKKVILVIITVLSAI